MFVWDAFPAITDKTSEIAAKNAMQQNAYILRSYLRKLTVVKKRSKGFRDGRVKFSDTMALKYLVTL